MDKWLIERADRLADLLQARGVSLARLRAEMIMAQGGLWAALSAAHMIRGSHWFMVVMTVATLGLWSLRIPEYKTCRGDAEHWDDDKVQERWRLLALLARETRHTLRLLCSSMLIVFAITDAALAFTGVWPSAVDILILMYFAVTSVDEYTACCFPKKPNLRSPARDLAWSVR
jgi:hypothetical protein